MNKTVLFGKEARDKVLEGVKKIAAAVKVTLGASGKCVLISNSFHADYALHQLPIQVTKDGYTVTRNFNLSDPIENVGSEMIKEAAQKTVDMVGDGTTTTTILAEAFIRYGIEAIDKGANSQKLKKEIDKAVDYVVEMLKKMAIPVRGDVEKIRQIATVSANNDTEIGTLIAEAFEKIGEDGIIDIQESKSPLTEVKIADGFKFDKGWLLPYFITNKAKAEAELIEPYILLYDNPISKIETIAPVLQQVVQQGKPILIICEDMDSAALALVTMNVAQGKLKACVVKCPSFNNSKKETMEDLAIVTGGTYISDQKGISLENAKLQHLGVAKKVIVTKDSTIIIDGERDKESFDELYANLKMNIVDAKDEIEKQKIEKRIARLKGGVAVISVGGATETEMGERRDRVDDAVRATKAAVEEGYVAGGGISIIMATDAIDTKRFNENPLGYGVLIPSMEAPFRQICINAGVDDTDILAKITEFGKDIGYNAKTDTIENLIESGIIDPVKALRCSIINAASVAGMVLTSECLIVDGY